MELQNKCFTRKVERAQKKKKNVLEKFHHTETRKYTSTLQLTSNYI